MDKYYQVILADPPWAYRAWSKKQSRTADSHYQTMSAASIAALPVDTIAAENSVLLLWATAPCLRQAFDLLGQWGFVYRTVAFCWVKMTDAGKPKMGLGHHTRSNVELVLLGVRGKGVSRVSKSVRQVVQTIPGRHSAKPAEVGQRIVDLYGIDVTRIELFARDTTEGWDCWGNEIPAQPDPWRLDHLWGADLWIAP
jgi:N6-adenosine-specific RNA methylase IME4